MAEVSQFRLNERRLEIVLPIEIMFLILLFNSYFNSEQQNKNQQ